jgi:predicted acylesterase/phospholipase RssA
MRKRTVLLGVVAVGLVILGGVAARELRLRPRLQAVPEPLARRAEIPGIPGARYWVGADIGPFVRDVLAARERELKHQAIPDPGGALPPAALLAVSGGGDKGAFGAGLLCGWSASGTRPEFKAVTGVSTGALIAPFAFAGPDYDEVLRTVYTTLGPSDIASKRSVLAAITDDGMADNRPLWNLIARYVDDALLKRIAAEHERGRMLLVGTTNLDARQPIIWNVGNIAASGASGALDLVRSILLASAAIPGAFPPTMIRVEADGRAYEEMHVDGGASSQVFLYPPRLRTAAASMGTELKRAVSAYVIRNSYLLPTYAPVERRTISIAGPAIASLIHTQGFGDLFRIYLTALQDGLDFNLAYIDQDFSFEHTTDFDTAYMKALFDYGFRQGRDGYPWKKTPPLFEPAAEAGNPGSDAGVRP